jgi:hypothetical protein
MKTFKLFLTTKNLKKFQICKGKIHKTDFLYLAGCDIYKIISYPFLLKKILGTGIWLLD